MRYNTIVDTALYDIDEKCDLYMSTPSNGSHLLSFLSASIDDDDYFELMVRNSWHISGGTGMVSLYWTLQKSPDHAMSDR